MLFVIFKNLDCSSFQSFVCFPADNFITGNLLSRAVESTTGAEPEGACPPMRECGVMLWVGHLFELRQDVVPQVSISKIVTTF